MQHLISVDFRITSTWHVIMDQVEMWRVNESMKQENQDPNAQRRKHLKDSALRKTIDHISETFRLNLILSCISQIIKCCIDDQNFI